MCLKSGALQSPLLHKDNLWEMDVGCNFCQDSDWWLQEQHFDKPRLPEVKKEDGGSKEQLIVKDPLSFNTKQRWVGVFNDPPPQ